MKMDSLLIANRGEIARRVQRTAKRMGLRTIAVASELDRDAPFAREADELHVIGPAAPKDSYLKGDAIIELARARGADAIHPGYGFLSENADFAGAVEAAGLAFIGPTPETMRAVGGKLEARALAERAGVPLVPGSPPLADASQAAAEAERIGYPIMIKASAGGGGIGMTRVDGPKKLERAFAEAQRKGETFFGDGTVYLEKLIEHPAHVEVQILGDGHEVIALGDRDCTVQRRHQKVVEEAPSPRLSPELRAQMLEAAAELGRAARYRNAGTVEMIHGDGSFYFLEVNSRLQVEHPVTELVTGLDLVEQQIRIARGEGLPTLPEPPGGHAIEARICAEDPDKRFFPSPGRIELVHFPEHPHVRVDAGVASGSEVSPFYDSLLAKVIAWGKTRDEAIDRLRDYLAEARIEGLTSNLAVFPRVFAHEVFRAGTHDTSFLLTELGLKS
ncbi:MAG: biotin carboxylase N-terminal domain-containing protein [Myxococcota bacterium]